MSLKKNLFFEPQAGTFRFESQDLIFPFFPFECFIQTDWWLNYGIPLTAITMRGEVAYLLKMMKQGKSDLFLRTHLTHLFPNLEIFADFHFNQRQLTSIRFHPKSTDISSAKFHRDCRLWLRWLNRNCRNYHRFKKQDLNTYRYEQENYVVAFRMDHDLKSWECVFAYR